MELSEDMLKELLENTVALAAMPEKTVAAMRSLYEKAKQKREEQERREHEQNNRIVHEKAEDVAHIRKLLGLDIGEWVRNIPNDRRFVLAYRVGKRFHGRSGQEKDPMKWKDEDEYTPMDILRGYTGPYFGYCGGMRVLNNVVAERLIPALEARSEDELLKIIEKNFDFFSYHDEAKPFAVCSFTRDANENVVVTGHGEFKNLSEHLLDLRKEFENGEE